MLFRATDDIEILNKTVEKISNDYQEVQGIPTTYSIDEQFKKLPKIDIIYIIGHGDSVEEASVPRLAGLQAQELVCLLNTKLKF